jgi:hypothetical protein
VVASVGCIVRNLQGSTSALLIGAIIASSDRISLSGRSKRLYERLIEPLLFRVYDLRNADGHAVVPTTAD